MRRQLVIDNSLLKEGRGPPAAFADSVWPSAKDAPRRAQPRDGPADAGRRQQALQAYPASLNLVDNGTHVI